MLCLYLTTIQFPVLNTVDSLSMNYIGCKELFLGQSVESFKTKQVKIGPWALQNMSTKFYEHKIHFILFYFELHHLS